MCHVIQSVFAPRCVLRIGLLLIAAGAIPSGLAQAQQTTVSATSPPPPSPQQLVTCSSKAGERQVCAADTAAGAALLRSTGSAACLLGKTWGYDDKGIWVFDGCGGEFAVGSTHEASEGKEFLGTFEPYGQWRTHLAAFNDTAEVQDNATRVGINFRSRGAIKMFVGVEWGVNLVQSSTQFNLSAAGPGDFGAGHDDKHVAVQRAAWLRRHRFRAGRPGGDREAVVGPLRCHELHHRLLQRVRRPGHVDLRGGH